MALSGTILTYAQAEDYIKSRLTEAQYDKWLQDSDRDNYREDEDDYEFGQRWLKENGIPDNDTEDLAYCLYWCNE